MNLDPLTSRDLGMAALGMLIALAILIFASWRARP